MTGNSLVSAADIHLSTQLMILEASAGTGKTYTLARLALRLIIEKGIPIDQLLIVTFTEAATAELKDRIRSLLQTCRQEIDSQAIEETIILHARDQKGIDLATQKRRIISALDLYDEAAISTIHGFCKRALEESALENGLTFDAEIKNVDQELVDSIMQDFVRTEVAEHSPAVAAAFYKSTRLKNSLKRLGNELRSHPFAKVIPSAPGEDPRPSLNAAFDRIRCYLQDNRETTQASIQSILKKNSIVYRTLNPLLQSLEASNSSLSPLPEHLEKLSKINAANIAKALNGKGKTHGEPPLFTLAKELDNRLDDCVSYLIHRYKSVVFDRLRSEKTRLNTISFNDLLQLLAKALRSANGNKVAQVISTKFQAVLVDEFQDTDPTQYQILTLLFNQGAHYLYFIGDPKQAIYRFRGADIFTYIKATREASQRHTLKRNFRSQPKLIDAHNAFFALRPDFFCFDEIEYTPVESGLEAAEHPQWTEPCGDSPAPFRLALPQASPEIKSSQNWEDVATQWTSSKVQQLLFEENRYDDHPVQPSQIAILVNAHWQANSMQAALQKAGVESLIVADRSVFASPEAEAIDRLLAAIESPSRQAIVRAAIATLLFGYDYQDFQTDAPTEGAIEALYILFYSWNRDWQSRSFAKVLTELFRKTDAYTRLSQVKGGEKAIVNFQHLADLLHEEKERHDLSPASLRLYLQQKQEEASTTNSEWQQKMPNDSSKVQIYTIHKSKGLEFPFVFVPFIGLQVPKGNSEAPLYHASNDSESLTLDLDDTPTKQSREKAFNESLAEFSRLLYVALTRAKAASWLIIPPYCKSKNSPGPYLQHLLNSEAVSSVETSNDAYQILHETLAPFASKNEGATHLETFDPSEPFTKDYDVIANSVSDEKFQAKEFTRTTPIRQERVLSFSALSYSSHTTVNDIEAPDRDTNSHIHLNPIEADHQDPEPFSIFALPKGTATGNLIHHVLENLEFARPSTWKRTIESSLKDLAYPHAYALQSILRQIEILMAKPLETGSDHILLGELSAEQKRVEAEFALPSTGHLLGNIQNALRQSGAAGDATLGSWAGDFLTRENTSYGSMTRGFIDLVFQSNGRYYIADWKSNHIGNTASHYNQRSLAAAMTGSDYHLQYLIYTVALNRFLKTRVPNYAYETHFGGVFYIFLRGIEDSPNNNGVFFAKPKEAIIDALEEVFD